MKDNTNDLMRYVCWWKGKQGEDFHLLIFLINIEVSYTEMSPEWVSEWVSG